MFYNQKSKNRFGIVFPLFLNNIGLLLLDIFQLTGVLDLQGVTFFLLAFGRPLHFAAMFGFFSKFGFAHYGKLLGVGQVSIGVMNQWQFLLLYLSIPSDEERQNGAVPSFTTVNIIFLVLSIVSFSFPWFAWKRLSTKSEEENENVN